MAAEVKGYLQEHAIPQLFESLITGLICNKPEDPIKFLENSLTTIRKNPTFEYKWDSFVDEEVLREFNEPPPVKPGSNDLAAEKPEKRKKDGESKSRTPAARQPKRVNPNKSTASSAITASNKLPPRPLSAMRATEATTVPDVPIILFMGGPGGGKTRHAARVQEALSNFGLVHICMPDMVRTAILQYQNTDLEWKEAAELYQRGELIPNNLALELVKAEMAKHQNAKAFFLEGFPREARQVENFEREVRAVNMAIILDYDESTLRNHMERRGLGKEVIDAKIREFKLKTLPSAKYFDDQRLLHLIPGEQSDQWIFERMKLLIQRAMELGVPVTTSKVASRTGSPLQQPDSAITVAQAAAAIEAEADNVEAFENKAPLATKDEAKASEKGEDKKPTSSGRRVGAEAEPATSDRNSPAVARDITNTATAAPEKKATPQMTPGNNKPSTALKRELSSRRNTADGLKPDEIGGDSTMKSVTDTEIREKTEILTASSGELLDQFKKSVAQPALAALIATDDASLLERSSQSSKQSTRPGAKRMSRKLSRTTSQTSKSSEMSLQSVQSAKSDCQSVHSIRSESQLATDGPLSDLKSNTPSADDRFPPGLPNNASAIVIVGPPGSNKAEISKRLACRYDGFTHLSMGDLLRGEVQANADDQLWQRIGKKMNAGEPVPTKICRELLYSKIYNDDSGSSGYVIEGYPRAKNQAIDFEKQIDPLTLVILIDCTEEFCIKAIAKRKKDELTNRQDDNTEAAVSTRLQMFKQNTLPMLRYFDKKGKLKVIDGDNDLDKIFEEIVEELDSTPLGKGQKGEWLSRKGTAQ
ncbi:unnamed protein product [Litomosoides sigmodontis]|uniref:Uncharacterized protein n=1 Tax=Litomosoides sigmodontis TaxID=42156 RepID=A0A3P6USY4_LITSI|nr:unnamed protein product [Litomosoides sigmodontis]